MMRVNGGEVAWALERSTHISDYYGKYVTFKGNSDIFMVNKVQVSTVMPDGRPYLDLRLMFFVNSIRDPDTEIKLQLGLSFDVDTFYAMDSQINLFEYLAAKISENVSIIKNSGALEILYAKKSKNQVSFTYETWLQNGRHSNRKY